MAKLKAKFEVGKSYALHLPAKDGNGKNTFLTDIYTVTKRTPCYLTFSHISSYGSNMPHCRCKIFTSDSRGEFVHATAFFCLYADSYIDDETQPDETATAEITPVSTEELYHESVADKNVLSFFNTILASGIDSEKYVRVFASMCLYEKITSTSEPHKFSNLPEAEIRVMLGFDARYNRLGSERGMYGLFTNDLNTVNVEDTAKAAKYFVELVHSVFQADYDKATGHNSEITTSASYNDNAMASQPASVSSTQSDTSAITNAPKFVVGKIYKHYIPQYGARIYTVMSRDNDTVTFGVHIDEATKLSFAKLGYTTSEEIIDTFTRKTSYSSGIGEYIFFDIANGYLYADDVITNDSQPEISAPAEISQPENLYMDDSYSDAPGDNSCPDMDIPECREPETIPTEIAQTVKHVFTPGNVYISPDNRLFTVIKRSENFCTLAENNGKIFRRKIFDSPDHEFVKLETVFSRLPLFMSAKNVKDNNMHADNPGDNSQPDQDIPECREPDTLHADNPGFTIVPAEHITRPDYSVYPDTIIDECTYVTVYACDKHEITPRRNPITEAKFKWVNQFLLAVFFLCKFIIPVIYARKYNIRDDLSSDFTKFTFNTGLKYSVSLHNKIQFITINDRRKDKFGFSWLDFSDEDNISYSARVKLRDDCYTELLDFKEFDRACYAFEGVKPVKEANRVKYVKFEVGKSYSAVSERWGHHERHITVIDRFTAVPSDCPDAKHKRVYIKVRMSGHAIKADYVEGWISCYVNKDDHTEEYSSLHELIFRADMPDAVKEIPPEINDITPQPTTTPKKRKHNPATASDIEHKLIETKDLHFAQRRKALEHNAAVISSCMFHEAVISLLSSISLQAIILLGFHMRLFIAKPKGKKNVIAEMFAKRLIDSRELRPNLRSTSDNINAKNTAPVPDNVKFVQLKNRQLGFIFTE